MSSLKAVLECLEGHLNAVVGGLWDVVAGFGCLKVAIQGVVMGSQAVWAELVGLLGIVQEQLEDLLAAIKCYELSSLEGTEGFIGVRDFRIET